MRNAKFVLHKALADAYYTLFMKRKKLDGYLEELDINFDLDKGKEYYKEYRGRCRTLEDAFADLKVIDKAYRDDIKARRIKGSKEDKKHGSFVIHFCEYAIIEEGIISICEELGVPYNKVKNELYRLMQMYHGLEDNDIADPELSNIPIFEFMEGVVRKQWFHLAFSKNNIELLSTIIIANKGNYIKEEYIVHRTIW